MDIPIEYGYREDDEKPFPIEQLARSSSLRGKPDTPRFPSRSSTTRDGRVSTHAIAGRRGRPTCCRLNATTSMTAFCTASGLEEDIYELGVTRHRRRCRRAPDARVRDDAEGDQPARHARLLHPVRYDHVEDDEAEIMEARERELTAWADAGHEAMRGIPRAVTFIRQRLRKDQMALMGNDEETRDELPAARATIAMRGRTSSPLRRAFTCAGEGIRWGVRVSAQPEDPRGVRRGGPWRFGFALGISQAGMARRHLVHRDGMSLEVGTRVESVVDLVSPEGTCSQSVREATSRGRGLHRLLRLDRRRLRFTCPPSSPLGSFVAKTLRRRFKRRFRV